MAISIQLKTSNPLPFNKNNLTKQPPLTKRVMQAVYDFFTYIANWISTGCKSLKERLITKKETLTKEDHDLFIDALNYIDKPKPANKTPTKTAEEIAHQIAKNRDQFSLFLNKNLKNKILINVFKDKLLPKAIQSFEIGPDGVSFKLSFDKQYKMENIQVPKEGLTALNGINFNINKTLEGKILSNNSIQTIQLNSHQLNCTKKIGFLPITTSLTSVEIDNDLDSNNQKSITIQTGNNTINGMLKKAPISSLQLQETFKNFTWA